MTTAAIAPARRPDEVLAVPWRKVRPMEGQPREHFDREKLAALAASISEVGQVVPVLVAPLKGDRLHDYELIDGQRRWLAVQAAGLEHLRCVVVAAAGDVERYAMSVVANLAREGHHPLEVAVACEKLKKLMTADKVAATLGKSLKWVYDHIALLHLVPDVRQLLHPSTPYKDRLPFGAGVKLARLAPDRQLAALEEMRQSGKSPLKAAAEVVNRAGLGARRAGAGRGKKPSDDYAKLSKMLARFAADLDSWTPERLGWLLKGRREPERARVGSLAARLASSAIGLRDRLRDVGP